MMPYVGYSSLLSRVQAWKIGAGQQCVLFCLYWGHANVAGMNQISEKQMNEAEKQFKTFESMINSMTLEERSNPDLLAKVIAGPHSP